MIQVKNAYTGRGLSRPCYPLKNPHVSFPKRWTLDLLDPSQGPWLNLPKLKRWKARNDHVFEKVADAKLFQAFPCLSWSFMHFSISDHISHTSSVSSHAFRILSDPFGIFVWGFLPDDQGTLQQDWLPMGPELPNRWAGTHSRIWD